MLSTIRKFSSSIFAKIFLIIVAIPFIFWGMGDVFSTGNQNTIVKVGKEKVSTQDFIDWLKYNAPNPERETINEKSIENLLSRFIGEILISKEIKSLGIVVTDKALSEIIKNEKAFKRNNKFSKIEYSKFLLENNLNVVNFEANMLRQIEKEQLFTLIGGGIIPSSFSINLDYDKINQERSIEIVDLNEIFKKNLNFTSNHIENYFKKNIDKFVEVYKTVHFKELNPQNLSESQEYDDLFFKKIDEIDDLIAEGKNLNHIQNKFNLDIPAIVSFDANGKDKTYNELSNFPKDLIKIVYNSDSGEKTFLTEAENKYFILEVIKTENIQRKVNDPYVKEAIIKNLTNEKKRSLLSEIVNKINKDSFKKLDFNKITKDNNITAKKIIIKDKNDVKLLKKELIDQVYSTPEKKISLVTDMTLTESYLIYVDKVLHKKIEESSKEYEKYKKITKLRIINDLYSSYDSFLKNKYEVDINYKSLNRVKNFYK
tara:strand:- start:7127 stop:8581 length:1455 start_codon:yes stop_codon:yes gene_type:complete